MKDCPLSHYYTELHYIYGNINSFFLPLGNSKYNPYYRDFNLQLKWKPSLKNMHFICQTWFGMPIAIQFYLNLTSSSVFHFHKKKKITFLCSKFIVNCLNHSLSSMAADIKKATFHFTELFPKPWGSLH